MTANMLEMKFVKSMDITRLKDSRNWLHECLCLVAKLRFDKRVHIT